MGFRSFSLLLLSLALVTGCTNKQVANSAEQRYADQQHYARRAFRAQQADREHPFDAAIIDEPVPDDLILLIEEDPMSNWRRLPHETVDQWYGRIYRALVSNHEQLVALEIELEALSEQEREHINALQVSVKKSAKLRALLEEWEDPVDSSQLGQGSGRLGTGIAISHPSLLKPEFMVHLVRQGETLYSIANYYYGDGKLARDILLWNQGWIRSPYDLLAGTGLILFPKDARHKKQQVVDAYLQKLESLE